MEMGCGVRQHDRIFLGEVEATSRGSCYGVTEYTVSLSVEAVLGLGLAYGPGTQWVDLDVAVCPDLFYELPRRWPYENRPWRLFLGPAGSGAVRRAIHSLSTARRWFPMPIARARKLQKMKSSRGRVSQNVLQHTEDF